MGGFKGGMDLAKEKGLRVVFVDAYPRETTAFSTILTKVREANPDLLGVASGGFEDLVAITRQMKAFDRESEDDWADSGRGAAEILRGPRA